MRWNAAFTSIILSAGLTALVASNPAVAPPRVIPGPWGIQADDKTWTAYGKLYGSGNDNGALSKRNPTSPYPGATLVPQGDKNSWIDLPIGLWTFGLVTCVGVGVAGKPQAGTSARFLAHIQGSKAFLASEFKAFKTIVDDAKMDKAQTTAYISLPNLTQGLPDDWNDAQAKLGQDIEKAIISHVTDLLGKEPVIEYRLMQPVLDKTDETQGVMAISSTNEVQIAGKIKS